jgi:hypothetical protein
MATRTPERKGTDLIARQGQTAADYGNDPGYVKKNNVKPKDLKPGR